MTRSQDAVPTAHGPRERVVYAAAQLIRRSGVSATGLREIVAEARAPWGSLQHYFPGGKDQIVDEALTWSSRFAADRVEQYLEENDDPTPSGLLAVLVHQWRRDLMRTDYARGCPLVAATADVGATNDPLRDVVRRGFDTWQRPISAGLRRMGVPRRRAASMATLTLSALEGAIVMSRAQRDLAPLNTVLRELGPVLDAAAI